MAMGSKAFESPLVSHARMRAMYRALVEMRVQAEKLKLRSSRGVEACWVGTAIDLKDGDLTSDTGGARESALLAHLRAVGGRVTGGPITLPELKRLARQLQKPAAEAFPGSACDRVLCAAGAAMALKASGTQGIVVAYASLASLSGAEWKRVFAVMGQAGLPLVLMVLPEEGKVDLETLAVRAAGSGAAVPVIPVDAGDALAVYRVTQETIVRARAGGGAAAILGVNCGTDAVKLLGTQLVGKKICTPRWVAGVETHLKGLLASV